MRQVLCLSAALLALILPPVSADAHSGATGAGFPSGLVPLNGPAFHVRPAIRAYHGFHRSAGRTSGGFHRRGRGFAGRGFTPYGYSPYGYWPYSYWPGDWSDYGFSGPSWPGGAQVVVAPPPAPALPQIIVIRPATAGSAMSEAKLDYSYVPGCHAIPNGYHCDSAHPDTPPTR